MGKSITAGYEKLVASLLDIKINRGVIDAEIRLQWPPFKNNYGRSIYSPSVDIAVGPFAIEGRLIKEYNKLANENLGLIKKLVDGFKENILEVEKSATIGHLILPQDIKPSSFCSDAHNQNARCFMAIEVEYSGSRKHMLGDIVNAASLSRIGVIVPWDDKAFRAFFRIIYYFSFLKSVNKPTYPIQNLLIIKKNQFKKILNDLPDAGGQLNHPHPDLRPD